jgi:hypothetical protein
MSMKKQDHDEVLKSAMAIASRVEIETVRLLASSVRLEHPNMKAGLGVHLSHSVQSKVSEKGAIMVIPRFIMKGTTDKGGTEMTVVSIEATFLLTYSGEKLSEISPEQVAAFGQANGIYNAWPYWREFVQAMTTRMGLPPLVIPVFRLIGKDKSEKPKKAVAQIAHAKK